MQAYLLESWFLCLSITGIYRMIRKFSFLTIFLFCLFFVTEIQSEETINIAEVEKSKETKFANAVKILAGDNFYEIHIADKPFARYVKDFEGTPIIYPIYIKDDKLITRSFPMENRNVITNDHLHHRSFWFTHGKVNGTDFWLTDKKLKNIGKIVHRKTRKAEVSGENTAIIVTENNWINQRNEIICSDIRSFNFGVTELGNRYIDFEITVTALADKVTFYDTKEGTFGIRVADSLAVDTARSRAKAGAKQNKILPSAYIVNAEDKFDEEAWGKRSAWVDYVGQLNGGETVGIAVMNHPSSFRYPTYWHVRTYGLFAANPFGERSFGVRKKSNQDKQSGGDFVMTKGQSFMLRYKIIFHSGEIKKSTIKEEFKKYSNEQFIR
jgi:hypothetical protein